MNNSGIYFIQLKQAHIIEKRDLTKYRLIPFVWDDKPVALAFMQDVTQLKMMEKDLQQAQRMEAIGILSGGIAHYSDLNNLHPWTILVIYQFAYFQVNFFKIHLRKIFV